MVVTQWCNILVDFEALKSNMFLIIFMQRYIFGNL